MSERRERKISTPLVLASSSAMITVGLLAWLIGRAPDQIREEETQRAALAALRIDDRTPEAVAESFLDAWRRRAWDEAERISTGEAHERVQSKRASDDALNEEDREMARQVWATLAGAPLEVTFSQSDTLSEDRIALRGVAAYALVRQPYAREMEWMVVRVEIDGSQRWRVERMVNGRVLTDLPDLLGGGEEDAP